jgi:4-amino-4-deoxy-L-arabinose transferase-like glycosyltransferase
VRENTPIRPIELAALVFAAALLLVPALGNTPFYRAEIYFADVSRAMVERGDWLVPYYKGESFFDKPALTYWLMAASFKTLGFTFAAARVPSVIAAIGVILATVWLGWLLWGERAAALTAGWVLLATLSFTAFGRMAMSDMLLTLWTVLAMAFALLCYRAGSAGALALVALGAVLGLGFMTKGPIALLIPGFGILSLAWSRRKQLPALPARAVLSAAVVFLVVTAAWFAAIYWQMGSAPLEHFFLRENLQRFSGEAHNTGRPPWFYVPAFLGGGAPWSLFLFPAAAFCFTRPDREGRMLLGWMFLVVLLLSASRGKIDYYLLPLYPAVALCIGRYFEAVTPGRAVRRLAAAVLVVTGLMLALTPLAVSRLPLGWRPQGMEMAATVALCLFGGLICIAASFRPEPRNTVGALAIAAAAVFSAANIFVVPAFHSGQPNEELVEDVRRELQAQPGAAAASREDPVQVHRELLFYLRVPMETSNDLPALAASSRPYLLLADSETAAFLKLLPKVREIGAYEYLSSATFTLRGLVREPQPRRIVLLANFGSNRESAKR